MKTTILTALLIGAASQAAGCIIVSDDSNTGDAQVTWDLLSADVNGNPIAAGCPAGATTATIFALLEGAPAGDAYVDKYDCLAGAGTAAELPEGRYLVWVRLTDTSEATLFAESGSLITSIVSGSVTPVNHDIFVDHAFYQIGWTLTRGSAISCAQATGENGVSLLATHTGGSFIDTVVDCESGEGGLQTLTDPLPSTLAGSQYTMAVALINATNQSIGDAPTIAATPDLQLDYGNKYVDLGIVNITVR